MERFDHRLRQPAGAIAFVSESVGDGRNVLRAGAIVGRWFDINRVHAVILSRSSG
jgi:hypothetical protein